MTARRNLSQQRRVRYYGNSLNLNPGAFTKMKQQVSLLQTKRVSAGKPAASRKWPHNFYISSEVGSYVDKVYSMVRKTYDRGPTDEMEDLDVNAAT